MASIFIFSPPSPPFLFSDFIGLTDFSCIFSGSTWPIIYGYTLSLFFSCCISWQEQYFTNKLILDQDLYRYARYTDSSSNKRCSVYIFRETRTHHCLNRKVKWLRGLHCSINFWIVSSSSAVYALSLQT